MQHFKLVNWRIRGFVFWCHEQVMSEVIFWSLYILFILFCRIPFINLKRVVKWGYILKPCNTIKAPVGRWRLCKKDSGHTRMNQGHRTHNARLFFEVHVVVVEQIGLFRAKESFISGYERLFVASENLIIHSY